MAQRPNASHEVLHYGLRPLSHLSQIFRDCTNAGTLGERPAQPLLPIAALFLQRNGRPLMTKPKLLLDGCLKHLRSRLGLQTIGLICGKWC